MKSTRTIISNALILTLILAGSMVFAQNPPEIERALQVQGARVYSLIFRIEQILIKENPRKAGEILREAAEMGNLPSQESLSFLYLKNWDNAKSTDSTNDEMIDFMENNAEYFTQLAAKQNN